MSKEISRVLVKSPILSEHLQQNRIIVGLFKGHLVPAFKEKHELHMEISCLHTY